MSWKIHEKRTYRNEFDFPTVSVSEKSGLSLSRSFVDTLCKEYTRVVVYTDKAMKKLGLWFFKDGTLPKEYRINAYFLIKDYSNREHTRHSWSINCKTLLKHNTWISEVLTDGFGVFNVSQGSIEEGADFFVVDLSQQV